MSTPRRPRVPFFTQAATVERDWESTSRRLAEVFGAGAHSQAEQVSRLEAALAGYTGAEFAVAVGGGTDALVLLLRAAGLRRGDEVVLPAFGAGVAAAAVTLAGGRPVFADVDPADWALDPAAADAAVTARTRAVLPVHAFHQLADLAALAALARRRDLLLVEDSAEAVGMRWGGRHAGLLGVGGVLSFRPPATLAALGDAGLVLTRDGTVAGAVRRLRDHGREAGRPGMAQVAGINSKMDELQAAVLLSHLDRLDERIAVRAERAAAYGQRLRTVPGVLRVPTVRPRAAPTRTVFSRYVVAVRRREELAAWLADRGIGCRPVDPPEHLRPCFAGLGYRAGQFPAAEHAGRHGLQLPLHPDLPAGTVDLVCDAVAGFYAGRP